MTSKEKFSIGEIGRKIRGKDLVRKVKREALW